uniref:BTB domain-containing protein n=1 Tax=Steinernema glaseri TaxID=37863 RepID=A0A1I7Y8U3_9BILA
MAEGDTTNAILLSSIERVADLEKELAEREEETNDTYALVMCRLTSLEERVKKIESDRLKEEERSRTAIVQLEEEGEEGGVCRKRRRLEDDSGFPLENENHDENSGSEGGMAKEESAYVEELSEGNCATIDEAPEQEEEADNDDEDVSVVDPSCEAPVENPLDSVQRRNFLPYACRVTEPRETVLINGESRVLLRDSNDYLIPWRTCKRPFRWNATTASYLAVKNGESRELVLVRRKLRFYLNNCTYDSLFTTIIAEKLSSAGTYSKLMMMGEFAKEVLCAFFKDPKRCSLYVTVYLEVMHILNVDGLKSLLNELSHGCDKLTLIEGRLPWATTSATLLEDMKCEWSELKKQLVADGLMLLYELTRRAEYADRSQFMNFLRRHECPSFAIKLYLLLCSDPVIPA